MRATSIVEAVVALALGAGAGAGFLLGTGDLKSGSQIEQLEREKTDVEHKIDEHKREASERQDAISAKARADSDKARADAEQARIAEAQRKIDDDKKKLVAVEKLPPFGLLTIKALSGDLDIDGGVGLKGTGKTVDLAFQESPGKIKVKTGKFTVIMTPKVAAGKMLSLDVQVSPLAIITADGNRVGTSAPGLQIERKPFKLDFASPAAGDMNLLLTFKK